MQKERGSNSSKMMFLCLTSTFCGEKQAKGRGCHAQASPQLSRLCQQRQTWGAVGTSLPSHTGRGTQGLHAWTHLFPAWVSTGLWANAATPISPALFFFFFSLSVLKAEQREAPGMLKPLLNLVSLLPQGNTPQSHHLLPAYLCTLLAHSDCKCTGAGTVIPLWAHTEPARCRPASWTLPAAELQAETGIGAN